jgi:pimeloyl-ACP methyl ester carboxylesterase
MAAEPTLPTWVRYLCESWAQDITLDLGGLTVPTLLVQPEFDSDFYFDPANDYMRGFVHGTWDGVEELSDQISVAAVKDSRVFIMDDQPEELDRVVEAFLVDLPAR